VTPFDVPLTVTEALGTPCPDSLVTRPFTVMFCAAEYKTNKVMNKHSNPNFLNFPDSSLNEVDAWGGFCVTVIFIIRGFKLCLVVPTVFHQTEDFNNSLHRAE
jgi:hypothetical protein